MIQYILNGAVKAARHDASMTQKEVASAIGSSQEVISRIENGRQDLSLLMATRLSGVFNIPLQDIYTRPDVVPSIESTVFQGIKNKMDRYQELLSEDAGKIIDEFIDYVILITPNVDAISGVDTLTKQETLGDHQGWNWGLRHFSHYLYEHLAGLVNWSGLTITRRRRQTIKGADDWLPESYSRGFTPLTNSLLERVGDHGGIVEAQEMSPDSEWAATRSMEYLVMPALTERDRQTFIILVGHDFTRSNLKMVESVAYSFFARDKSIPDLQLF